MSRDWITVTGPADWFQCRIPEDWRPGTTGDELVLYAPDGRSLIRVHAFWHADTDVPPLQMLEPTSLFPDSIALRKVAPLQTSQAVSCGFEGHAPIGAEPGVLKRLFSPQPRVHWLAWAMRRGHVALICTIERAGRGVLSAEQKAIARQILETVVPAADPTMPPSVFAESILSRAKDRFDEPTSRAQGLHLSVGDARVNLLSFYRRYAQSPQELDDICESVLHTLQRLLRWEDHDFDAELAAVRDRVMPMLIPESLWARSFSEFVSETWIADLRIMYVVDEEDAYWYIRRSLLAKWDTSLQELHKIALENLDSYFASNPGAMTKIDGENGPKLLMPSTADAYNSVRLLNEPFHRDLQRLLGPEFAVGIPNRDFFVAVSLKNTETVRRVRGKVASDFQTMDHPLTDRLLIVSTDGVSEYCDG